MYYASLYYQKNPHRNSDPDRHCIFDLCRFVSDAGQRVPKEIGKVLPKLPTNPMNNASSSNFNMSDDQVCLSGIFLLFLS